MMTSRLPIRIATWNCFGVPHSAEDFFAGIPFWPERFQSQMVSETLGGYDIVCIQENLVDHVRESLERLRKQAGFAELWFDPMGPDPDDGTMAGGGLAILSRWPITTRFTRLPRGAGMDGFARKGFAVAQVRLPDGRKIHVINTHLQADDALVPASHCQEARAAQVAEIAKVVAELHETGCPAVLCGDLNIPPGTVEYDEMRRAFGERLVDIAEDADHWTYDAHRNDLAAVFHSGGPERARFDYIWASRDHFVAREVRLILDEPLVDAGACPSPRVARAFPSDHFGVGTVLDLLHAPPAPPQWAE
jgi:endonuclease/exonuclease/phosphatase family metal-dependent hydrolase